MKRIIALVPMFGILIGAFAAEFLASSMAAKPPGVSATPLSVQSPAVTADRPDMGNIYNDVIAPGQTAKSDESNKKGSIAAMRVRDHR